MSWLDRLFAPVYAGGWAAGRVCLGLALLAVWVPRAAGMGDVWGVSDMVFSEWPFHLTDHWVPSLAEAWAIWAGGLLGAGLVLWGGRATRLGLLLWLACEWVLLAVEGLNIKAYDRLLFWVVLGFLVGPASERGLLGARRGPAARWFLLIVYSAIYGSTGWLKVTEEGAAWARGEVLAYHLVHRHFGLQPLGVWASTQPWLTQAMSWGTLAFECLFPVLVWSRRANPPLLALGAAMHLGILVLMNVGPFSYVALAAYPVLLHPEAAARLAQRLRRAPPPTAQIEN